MIKKFGSYNFWFDKCNQLLLYYNIYSLICINALKNQKLLSQTAVFIVFDLSAKQRR